ncbi:Lrp/AsnC family transcriptional regulator [Streptomyces sp. NPDC057596]|uniref:Lrp/AsnC family transcriptional regulator n=1 Tax=Streptomyces sp. NPDC057596 TaxID=3346178 RepID=UPI00367A5A61
MTPATPDTLDLKLLQALELDGRAPFSRIAQVLGVSDQTIARRFRRLRTTVNLRVTGMVDDSRLGRAGWIVRLGCAPNTAARPAAVIAGRPDTHYVDLAAGGTEVVCAIRPRSSRERDELLLERLQGTPHVTAVDAHCVLHAYYGNSLRRLRKISALEPAEEAALRRARTGARRDALRARRHRPGHAGGAAPPGPQSADRSAGGSRPVRDGREEAPGTAPLHRRALLRRRIRQ